MGVTTDLLRISRAFVGCWSELRKIRVLMEWLYTSNISATVHAGNERYTIIIDAVMLPPTEKEIKAATADEHEYDELIPEEQRAVDAAVRILRRRAKGETIEDDDPDAQGKDFDIF